MCSLVKEDCISYLQLLGIKYVKRGRVPKHVALIMDGCRRYAKKSNLNIAEGHYAAFVKLSETIKWCLELGIPELTVFALSLDNLKRSKEELGLWELLARLKCQEFFDNTDKIQKLGIRVKFVGRMSLISEDTRRKLSRVMVLTRNNHKLRLNFALLYTGRDEISRAASCLVDAVNSNQIKVEDIDETLMSHTMELGEPELVIRTSGETKLSDFLLWQVSNAVLYFPDPLWPEFSLWDFLTSIRHFQKHAPSAKKIEALDDTKREFIANLETQRWNTIETYASLE